MKNEVIDEKKYVLRVVSEAKQPIGWYQIAQILSMRGILLQDQLPLILGRLVASGHLVPRQYKGKLVYELGDKPDYKI
jgi:hypothetical protein